MPNLRPLFTGMDWCVEKVGEMYPPVIHSSCGFVMGMERLQKHTRMAPVHVNQVAFGFRSLELIVLAVLVPSQI